MALSKRNLNNPLHMICCLLTYYSPEQIVTSKKSYLYKFILIYVNFKCESLVTHWSGGKD